MAIFYMLLASASFATMSALIKAIGTSLPVQEVMFLRTLLALPILLFFVLKNDKPLVVHEKGTLLIRSFFGISAMLCFYYAITNMPLAECVFVSKTQPFFVAILAPFIIGEKASKTAVASIILGIIGVSMILKPGISVSTAALVAIFAAFLSALAHIMIRKLNKTDDPLTIVFNFTFLGLIVTGIAVIDHFIFPTALQWIYLAGIALFASSGQLLLTHAYRHGNAPVVAAASYSSVIMSVAYGYFFWQETVGLLSLLGGLLIVAGGINLVINNKKKV